MESTEPNIRVCQSTYPSVPSRVDQTARSSPQTCHNNKYKERLMQRCGGKSEDMAQGAKKGYASLSECPMELVVKGRSDQITHEMRDKYGGHVHMA
jgi:hypothetical protein